MTAIKIAAVIILAIAMAFMIAGIRHLLEQPLLGPIT